MAAFCLGMWIMGMESDQPILTFILHCFPLFSNWCFWPAVYQSGHGLGFNSTLDSDLNTTLNSITRKAGGRKEVDKEMQVCDIFLSLMSIYSMPQILAMDFIVWELQHFRSLWTCGNS